MICARTMLLLLQGLKTCQFQGFYKVAATLFFLYGCPKLMVLSLYLKSLKTEIMSPSLNFMWVLPRVHNIRESIQRAYSSLLHHSVLFTSFSIQKYTISHININAPIVACYITAYCLHPLVYRNILFHTLTSIKINHRCGRSDHVFQKWLPRRSL